MGRLKEKSEERDLEPGGVPLCPIVEQPPRSDGGTTSKRKRKPRKLPGGQIQSLGSSAEVSQSKPRTGSKPKLAGQVVGDVEITTEVQALKDKVIEIEAQVQEILLRPAGPSKSSRRRNRQQKSSKGDHAQELQEDAVPEESQSAEDLKNLSQQLETATRELKNLKKQNRTLPEPIEDEDVEDIPRSHSPAIDAKQRRPLGRSVTLSGSYRLPIPVQVSGADFDAISKGIKSAQSIAKAFMDSRSPREEGLPAPDTSTSSSSQSSWSSWIGGYSMSLVKAVDSMQLTSTVESTLRPARPTLPQRAETAPVSRRKPQKLELRGKGARPKVSPHGEHAELSQAQINGLLA